MEITAVERSVEGQSLAEVLETRRNALAKADRVLARTRQALQERLTHQEDALVEVDLELAIAEHNVLMRSVHGFDDMQKEFEGLRGGFRASLHALKLRTQVAEAQPSSLAPGPVGTQHAAIEPTSQ
ncbi:Hypothetical Protein FCC1311_047322 [Hondaea fermentalgiana]|uniref:Uncharacterized protein n=1 Tax=Hondaea fermentalgiana TaxID=2315210 RepID=A0A2R5GDU5_9STRA|nr:Hypothetical Protein FCC1311_047322 [Hondaea fermentalgiana]|eukprot:GBG28509.1 Hypothetical Protein FCC1311_047322 [Hondaea fermentalgiana]